MVGGHSEIPGAECHRHKNGFGKDMMTFGIFGINGYLAWMLADVQTNHGRSFVHVQWFSHQNNGADYHDIIK